VQYDEDDGNHDQNVNPIAGLREAWTDSSTEKAEQPQDEQDYDDGPQHDVSPFERPIGCCRLPDRVTADQKVQQVENSSYVGDSQLQAYITFCYFPVYSFLA
jgi:hypothetical protein